MGFRKKKKKEKKEKKEKKDNITMTAYSQEGISVNSVETSEEQDFIKIKQMFREVIGSRNCDRLVQSAMRFSSSDARMNHAESLICMINKKDVLEEMKGMRELISLYYGEIKEYERTGQLELIGENEKKISECNEHMKVLKGREDYYTQLCSLYSKNAAVSEKIYKQELAFKALNPQENNNEISAVVQEAGIGQEVSPLVSSLQDSDIEKGGDIDEINTTLSSPSIPRDEIGQSSFAKG